MTTRHPTAAELSQAQRDSAAAAGTRAELDNLRLRQYDEDNEQAEALRPWYAAHPDAQPLALADVLLALFAAASVFGALWLFLQVTR